MEDPRQGDARDRHSVRFRDVAHDVDAGERASLVDGGKVEGDATRALRPFAFAVVLAGEQAAGERAPDHQADALGFEERHDLALDVAAGDRVVGLERR